MRWILIVALIGTVQASDFDASVQACLDSENPEICLLNLNNELAPQYNSEPEPEIQYKSQKPINVYRADECIGSVVNGKCHGTILPKSQPKKCHGQMVAGRCTGAMF